MGYLKCIGTVIIYIGLFLAVITFLPGLPPKTEFEEFSIVLPNLDSKVSPKNRLNGAQKLFEKELHGPEDLVTYNGQLYTGVHGGYVVRVEEDRIVPIVKFGQQCDGIWQEKKCGRPLGLHFDKKGNLYVVDTYYGIFKVNVATGEYKNIVNTSKPIEGKVPRIPNGIDVAENGDLYWTDSSTDFELHDAVPAFLSNPSGRLIRYNAAKKRNEVLIRNIGFANGVVLNDDESYVIVSDMTKHRLLKYNLKGPKTGQTEIFIEGLLGPIDNLHRDGHGGFFGVLYFAIDPEHPHILASLTPHPYLRKMLVRLLIVMELPIKLLHDIYPNTYAERLIHAIGSPQGFEEVFDTKKRSYVLRIDASGNIVDSIFADDDTVGSGFSAACIHNDYLWLGSPQKHYLVRVPLKQAFPDLANSERQSSERTKQGAKSTESKQEKVSSQKSTATPTKSTAAPTTSKPTATTPKPTAAPKPSPTPKVDKSSETKSTSKSAEIKKESANTVNHAKPSAKSSSPNAKSENSRTKEDAAKTSTKSEKNVKVEQDTSTKQKTQKSQPEKVKSETNRPKEEL
nr:PREDICTED: adipocyte plasma membrane-associated protein-like [Linepithema humile]